MPAPDPGFTRHVAAEGGMYSLDLLVCPDADLDGTFRAWCVDTGEQLSVNGWLFIIEDMEPCTLPTCP
jgi:hypothetical protein